MSRLESSQIIPHTSSSTSQVVGAMSQVVGVKILIQVAALKTKEEEKESTVDEEVRLGRTVWLDR